MNDHIAVIGLGYVGLPLSIALAKSFNVTGFDTNMNRIKELRAWHDRTGEIDSERLKNSSISLASSIQDIAGKNIYIVTVPTPVDESNRPDLTAVKMATEMVGSVIKQGSIIVYESTVYPGVTEDICGPLLEKVSGLKCGQDFFIGYSPERINPGDKVHTVDKIVKIVAGQNPEISQKLAEIYGTINNNAIFVAANIKTAEAAKVIENAQRDINVAFMNEIAVIFDRLNISTYDVLEAANTKWNFLPFSPGLVGGHCIGVDPYYLAECAKDLGLNAEVILSGRRVNDAMGNYIAGRIHHKMSPVSSYGKKSRVLILGFTFKENVPDCRNTKVIDLVRGLESYGHEVVIHDVVADKKEVSQHFNLDIENCLEALGFGQQLHVSGGASLTTSSFKPFDCVVGAVAHDAYKHIGEEQFKNILTPNGLVADIKNMWSADVTPNGASYWKL